MALKRFVRRLPRHGMCALPLIGGHTGLIEITLLISFFLCLVATFIILSDYKCPKCGMQLDYNQAFGARQKCRLCGNEVFKGEGAVEGVIV